MRNPQLLDIYSDYLLSSFSLVTATGLAQLLDNGYSHDQISRFLAQGKFDQRDFWKVVKKLIRKIETSMGILAIDDTIEEKPHSTENDIICYHYDHSKNRSIKGINILNFVYHNAQIGEDGVTLPVAFEVIEKTETYYDKKAKKVKKRSPTTKNEMVRERLRILTELNRIQYRYVTWDTWFSSKENLMFVHHDLKKCFVSALKSNRLLALSEEDKRQGKFRAPKDLEFPPNRGIQVWLKGLDFPVQLIKQVFTNKDGSHGELYLVTNDLKLTRDDISAIYEKRWNVEVFHKSLKNNAKLDRSPTKYEVTQSNHIFASMIAVCKLEMLKLKENANHFALKSRLYVKALQAAFQELQRMKQSNKKVLQIDAARGCLSLA
jgi:hypothetical protein